MAKRFEYKGPAIIKTCYDCLYMLSDDFRSCSHPEVPKEIDNTLQYPYDIPSWCRHPDEKTEAKKEVVK